MTTYETWWMGVVAVGNAAHVVAHSTGFFVHEAVSVGASDTQHDGLDGCFEHIG